MNTAFTTKTNETILIIGGGAAGMLAAVSASRGKQRVTIMEQNAALGKKIAITGKGRCNLTNRCTPEEFLENTVTNPKFLMKAIRAFPPYAVMDFFDSLGVPLKTERGKRVFPQSDRAADVLRALSGFLAQSGVTVLRGKAVEIIQNDKKICGAAYLSDKGREFLPASAVILATGGASYPKTGSGGDGYGLAAALGHGIISPRPSLVPLVTKETFPRALRGLALKNIGVRFIKDEKELFSGRGELLFTHFGVSGPLVLSASAYIKKFPVFMHIDLKPALSPQTLDARLVNDFGENINKNFINALDRLLPKALIPVVAQLSGIDFYKKVHSVTREERRRLAGVMKALPLTISASRPLEEAIVTSGGVDVREINPSTMESRLFSGLFFAGEVMDYDCLTGGYNLQAAFSTGYVAGENAAGRP